jgi:hypothetical protein
MIFLRLVKISFSLLPSMEWRQPRLGPNNQQQLFIQTTNIS